MFTLLFALLLYSVGCEPKKLEIKSLNVSSLIDNDPNGPNRPEKIIDGDENTYFHSASAPVASDELQWVQLQLKTPAVISKITIEDR